MKSNNVRTLKVDYMGPRYRDHADSIRVSPSPPFAHTCEDPSSRSLPIQSSGSESRVLNQPTNGVTHNCAGAISQIDSGFTKLAEPTARPMVLLPNIIPHTVVLRACHSAPSTNSACRPHQTLILSKFDKEVWWLLAECVQLA